MKSNRKLNRPSITGTPGLVGAIALALVVLAQAPQTVAAQDIAGTWELTTMGGQGVQLTSTLTFTMEDDGLKGTIKTDRPPMGRGGAGRGGGVRGGGGIARTTTISDLVVEGSSFSFRVNVRLAQRSVSLTYALTYAGSFEGDEMTGTIEVQGDDGSRSFTGRRLEI